MLDKAPVVENDQRAIYSVPPGMVIACAAEHQLEYLLPNNPEWFITGHEQQLWRFRAIVPGIKLRGGNAATEALLAELAEKGVIRIQESGASSQNEGSSPNS